MSTTYDRSNYQRSKMPAKLDKEKLDFVTQAVMEYGWTAEPQSGVKVVLTAPDGKRISVSANDRPLHRYQMTVERHGHRHGTPRNPDPVVVRRVPVSPEPGIEKVVEMPAPPRPTKVLVVSEGPMLAYRNRKGYLSEVTGERKFNDGTVEYYCLEPGCDYVGGHRSSVARHRKVHGVKPKEGQPPATIEVPPHEPAYRKDYTPRADRVQALAAALQQAMEAGIDWTDLPGAARTLAEEALQWAHQQSEDASGLAGEREPLTAEQILARVRNLLDNGEYLAQRREIEALRERITGLEVTTAEAEKNAQRAHDTLRAFRDLAAEVD